MCVCVSYSIERDQETRLSLITVPENEKTTWIRTKIARSFMLLLRSSTHLKYKHDSINTREKERERDKERFQLTTHAIGWAETVHWLWIEWNTLTNTDHAYDDHRMQSNTKSPNTVNKVQFDVIETRCGWIHVIIVALNDIVPRIIWDKFL